MRIKNKQAKSSEENIMKYFKDMFCSMYHNGNFWGEKSRMYHNEKNWGFKLIAGKHKLMCKEDKNWDMVLITYARKREIDRIEGEVLRSIRRQTWNKKSQ